MKSIFLLIGLYGGSCNFLYCLILEFLAATLLYTFSVVFYYAIEIGYEPLLQVSHRH